MAEDADFPILRRVVIGLGSNLGERLENLESAVKHLRREDELRIGACAAVYETPPAGGPPQGDYLNTAVLVTTELTLPRLLDRALDIERTMGRVRDGERLAPRIIDLDLLWADGERVAEGAITVPHPRLGERVFALRPLLDVVPDARDPEGRPYAEYEASRQSIRRFTCFWDNRHAVHGLPPCSDAPSQ